MKLQELFEGLFEGLFENFSSIKISDEQWAKEVRNVYYNDDKSFGALVMMHPNDFLTLAAPDPDVYNRAKTYGTFSSEKLEWLPNLQLDLNNKVDSHEGRGRIEMMRQHGYNNVPVIIRIPKSKRTTNIEDFPTIIEAEESSNKLKVNYVSLLTYPLNNPLV